MESLVTALSKFSSEHGVLAAFCLMLVILIGYISKKFLDYLIGAGVKFSADLEKISGKHESDRSEWRKEHRQERSEWRADSTANQQAVIRALERMEDAMRQK